MTIKDTKLHSDITVSQLATMNSSSSLQSWKNCCFFFWRCHCNDTHKDRKKQSLYVFFLFDKVEKLIYTLFSHLFFAHFFQLQSRPGRVMEVRVIMWIKRQLITSKVSVDKLLDWEYLLCEKWTIGWHVWHWHWLQLSHNNIRIDAIKIVAWNTDISYNEIEVASKETIQNACFPFE